MVRRLMHAIRAAYDRAGAARLALVTSREEREREVAERKELERRLELLRQKVNGRQRGRVQ